MNKKLKSAVLVGVGLQILICLAIMLRACADCEGPSKTAIAGIGLLGYLAIGALALFGAARAVAYLLAAAAAVHGALAMQMIVTAEVCRLCAIAVLVAAGLLAAAAGLRRRALVACAVMLPIFGAAARGVGLAAGPRSHSGGPSVTAAEPGPVGVSVTVYEKHGCGYCARLRDEIMPQVDMRGVSVSYRDAEDAALVSRVPLIVIRGRRGSRVIEGLPDAGMLAREIEIARGQ